MPKEKRTGRPYAEINWKQVEALCNLQCTGEEIAGVIGVDYDTLNNAIKREHKVSFTDYFKKHSAGGRMSLRRFQFDLAKQGNATMLVWLGKQYLGQTDKVENQTDITSSDGSLKPISATPEQLAAVAAKLEG